MQAVEEERRKGSKGLREAKAAADGEALKAKQAVTEAEQQRQEAVRQCEAEGHRNGVKLVQAGRNLKTAKQEAADAREEAKVWLQPAEVTFAGCCFASSTAGMLLICILQAMQLSVWVIYLISTAMRLLMTTSVHRLYV